MARQERKPTSAAKQGTCTRCGEVLELAASLPKRLESPAYDIFRCAACGFIDWVALDTPGH